MSVSDDPDVAAVARIGAVPAILRVIGRSTGLRLTLVARVTDEIWKACAVEDRMNFGLTPGMQLELATTLCKEVRESQRAIVIDCASEDPQYRTHHTPKLYGIESYISVPIFLPDGHYFGNLCALDARRADIKNNDTLETFQLYAELIGLQLAADRREQTTNAALLDAQETATLREQFIAVLGHDVRSPLNAISMGVNLLSRSELPEKDSKVVGRIRNSASRIAHLVDDVLDFARGRLGGGIPVVSSPIADLSALFHEVVLEVQAANPGRTIHYAGVDGIRWEGDPVRLAQLLSNLLGNALQHGSAQAPARVALSCDPERITLAVSNDGAPIPDAVVSQLFQPFFRGEAGGQRAGLGLGLYIVSEIVASHHGRITVRSTADAGTTFECSFPVSNPD